MGEVQQPPPAPPEASDLEMLRIFLIERDIPCPQCSYNLRALTSDVCPECGERVRLNVHLVEPKQAAPIAGLIGLSAGAGLNGLLLIYAVAVIYQRGNGLFNRFAGVNAAGLVVLTALIVLWLLLWRWIRRLPAWRRWSLVAACWIASLLDLTIFSIYIR